jgi:hypothetical protein
MTAEKMAGIRWPRTFKELMARTHVDVGRSIFLSSEQRRAGRRDQDEALEDARSELASAVRALESLVRESKDGDDIEFTDMNWAVRDLGDAVDAMNDLDPGHENQIRMVQHIDGLLGKVVSDVHDEYKRWQREETRHRAEIIGLADRFGELAKKLKGIRL